MIIKKFLFYSLFLLFLFSSKIWANENIAFLDINYIVNKSKPSTLIINKIEKLKNQETKKLKKIEDELKKKKMMKL